MSSWLWKGAAAANRCLPLGSGFCPHLSLKPGSLRIFLFLRNTRMCVCVCLRLRPCACVWELRLQCLTTKTQLAVVLLMVPVANSMIQASMGPSHYTLPDGHTHVIKTQ